MDTTHFKKRLEEEKELVEKELSEIATRDPQNPTNWLPKKPSEESSPDENDNADIDEEIGARAAEVNELEGRLNEIIRALEKIEGGTYGICEISGEPIEEDRLEANPAARTCKAHMHDVL